MEKIGEIWGGNMAPVISVYGRKNMKWGKVRCVQNGVRWEKICSKLELEYARKNMIERGREKA